MRTISAASLAKISATSGIEPAIVVKVYWNGSAVSYADKRVEQEGLVGKLLSITGIDDVVDINASSSSAAITIVLDDADGQLKTIWNNTDIHKTRVQVLQWFRDLPLTDAFVIFDGVISSPIVWSEGSRTLQFEVVTQLEDREVGFSVEEGQFPFVAADLIGKAWPVVFGTVTGHRPIQLNEDASMIIARGFAVLDHDVWEAELNNLDLAMQDLQHQAQIANQLAFENVIKAGYYRSDFWGQRDLDLAAQYQSTADSYYAQVADYTQQYFNMEAEKNAFQEEYEAQQELEWSNIVNIPVVHANLPNNVAVSGRIGEFNITGRFFGVNNGILVLQTVERVLDPKEKAAVNTLVQNGTHVEYRYEPEGQKFTWIDGGTVVDIWNYPTYHLISLTTSTVLNVWARNKFGRAIVPREWYLVENLPFGNTAITRLAFNRAISTFEGEWDISDFTVDCVGSMSNNTVDIMKWAIEGYSNFTYDVASFADARTKVDGLRANFVLDFRMNTQEFLRSVAFQSRCAIWLNDNKFYLRFLPEELVAVETITESDIEVDSLTLSCTDTERLVTKFVATWRPKANQETPNKVILRYNIEKYGTHEEEFNFFLYNQYDFVAKAAEFWLTRKANSYKILRCRLFLNKMRIEAFDPVSFNLEAGLIANSAVTGIIQKAVYDSTTHSIDMEAWLPVRLGEMTKYTFAYPGSTTAIYPDDEDPHIITGNPLEEVDDEFVPATQVSTQRLTYTRGRPWQRGSGFRGNENPVYDDFIVILDPTEVNQTRPNLFPTANRKLSVEVKPVTQATVAPPTSNGYYGEIIERISANVYSCYVYTGGFDQEPEIRNVTIGFLGEDEVIAERYPINVQKTTIKRTVNGQEVLSPEYWAQPPLWM